MLLLVVIVILVFINVIAEQNSNDAKKVSSSEVTIKPYHIGDFARAGDIKWRIEKEPQMMKEMYGDYDSKKANGTYVLIEITGELTGQGSAIVSTSEFHLLDDEDIRYETTNNGEAGLKDLDRKSLSREQLNPNVPITGWIVFDIPEDAAGLKLVVGDLLPDSDQTALIDLGI